MTTYLDNASIATLSVSAQQKVSGWQTSPQPVIVVQGNGSQSNFSFNAKTSGTYTVTMTVDGTTGVATPSVN